MEEAVRTHMRLEVLRDDMLIKVPLDRKELLDARVDGE